MFLTNNDIDPPQCPDHQSSPGCRHLAPVVPLHSAQQLGEVRGVAVPRTPDQRVDPLQHLLLPGGPDSLLLVPPHLQQARLQALLCQGSHQVAVDVVWDLIQDIPAGLRVVFLLLSPVLGPVNSLVVRDDSLLLRLVVVIFFPPNVGVVVVLAFCLKTSFKFLKSHCKPAACSVSWLSTYIINLSDRCLSSNIFCCPQGLNIN